MLLVEIIQLSLCKCLQYLCDTSSTITILGDVNLPRIDWSQQSTVSDDIFLFLNFCNNFNLFLNQHWVVIFSM